MIELMVATAVSGFLIAAVLTAYAFTARGFLNLALWNEQDRTSRYALDIISQDIRSADAVVGHSADRLSLRSGTNTIDYLYDASSRTLTRRRATENRVLLRDVTFIRYALLARNLSNGDYDNFPVASPTNCKIVQVTWVCSAAAIGDKPTATESVSSARIVLRSQKL